MHPTHFYRIRAEKHVPAEEVAIYTYIYILILLHHAFTLISRCAMHIDAKKKNTSDFLENLTLSSVRLCLLVTPSSTLRAITSCLHTTLSYAGIPQSLESLTANSSVH